jgi:hypothetical protein
VHQRATLLAWENCRVDLLGIFGFAEDETGTWAGQSFVNGGGNYVGVRNRAWVKTSCHHSSEVSHVDPKFRANFVGDFAELGEV